MASSYLQPVVCLVTTFTLFLRASAFYDYENGYISDLNGGLTDDWGFLGGQTHQPKCYDIPSSMTLCRNIGYDTMRLPNLLDHETMDEAVDQTRIWVPLLNLHCHPDTQLFLCSLYAPVCLEPAVYPCKSLCEGVKRGCEERIVNYGYPWPEILDCNQFPDELCIEQVNFENTVNVCHACKQPLTFESLLDSYCWATFVAKIKIRKVVHDELGDKRLVTKGRVKFYKPKGHKLSKAEQKKLQLTITDGASCDCEAVTNPAKYTLVMGSKQGDRYVVTYVSNWSKDKQFKKALKAMRKGHDCKKQIDDIAGQTDSNNGGLSISGKPGKGTVDTNIDGDLPTDSGGMENNGKKNKKKKDKNKNKTKKNKKGRKKNNGDKNSGEEHVDSLATLTGFACVQCKQPIVYEHLIDLYCSATFVLKFKVAKLKVDENGDKQLIPKRLKAKDFYRQEGLSKRDLKKLQPVLDGSNSCDCISAVKGKALFVMGVKQGGRDVITFLSEQLRDGEFKRFTRAIRKDVDCSTARKLN